MEAASQNASRPRVLAWATNPVCALYRLQGPLSQLARDGHIDLFITEVFDQNVYEKLLTWAQIFVVQRARIDDTLRHVIKEAQRVGIRVVYEIDDDLLAISGCPKLQNFMTADDLTAIEEGLSLADRIHVSTQMLAERYARFGEVCLLENAFPVEPPPLQSMSDKAASLRVFYGAGRWHTPDWHYVVEALGTSLERAAITAGKTIEVELMGATWVPPESSTLVQYTVKAPAPWTTYLQAMSQADLALMPLEPNAHTDAKSPIKFYEAAAVGTPALALGQVYAQTIEHGVTGACASDPDHFGELAFELLTSSSKRSTLRQNAHDWVSQHALLRHRQRAWQRAFQL